MRILQKFLFSFAEKRSFFALADDYLPSIGKLLKLKRCSNKSAKKLVPYRPKLKQKSIFISAESMDNSALKTIENMIDETPIYSAKTYSRTLRQIEKLKYRKAKTIEEAKEYATKTLGIKSYDIPDVEVANQINLSMTNAIKKSRGRIKLPDKVEYTSITTGDKKFTSLDCPAQNKIEKYSFPDYCFSTLTSFVALQICYAFCIKRHRSKQNRKIFISRLLFFDSHFVRGSAKC